MTIMITRELVQGVVSTRIHTLSECEAGQFDSGQLCPLDALVLLSRGDCVILCALKDILCASGEMGVHIHSGDVPLADETVSARHQASRGAANIEFHV